MPIYPGYEGVRARFVNEWEDFREFLSQMRLSPPAIKRFQITYINHTDRRDLSPHDLLNNWTPPLGSEADGFSLSTTYRLIQEDADVTIVLQPALRTLDNVPITQTTITVSRRRALPTEDVAKCGLDDLHDVLISTFEQTSSSRAKEFWRPE
jgi:uncharacterized protein (TIGR04255 family)